MSGRDEEKHACPQPVFLACYAGVSHSVPALVEIERGTARLPARRPDGTVVIDVEISSSGIHRNPVVTVTQDSPVACVPAEAVASGRGRDQGEEILSPEIVYPGPWGCRIRDDELAGAVIEMSVNHLFSYLLRSPGFARDDIGEKRLEAHRAVMESS